jgi:hypothetical protein
MNLHLPGVVKRHWLVTTLSLIVATPIIVFALWTTITLHYTYSSGERAGYLQKISKKGWICKTWEGELLLTALPGAAPEKFVFTVRSDSIANELNKLNGQHVLLDYAQHVHVPSSCFGDTEYFVTGIRLVGAGGT